MNQITAKPLDNKKFTKVFKQETKTLQEISEI